MGVDVREVLAGLPWRTWQNEGQWGAEDCYPAYVAMGERFRPRRILEMGAFEGYGLASFWLGAGPAVERLDWVDNESYLPDTNLHCLENLRHVGRVMGWPLPKMAYATSVERLLVPEAGAPVYDLIHVDAGHDYQTAYRDMLVAWHKGPRVMLVDDFDFLPEVREAVLAFSRTFRAPFVPVASFRGWALFQQNMIAFVGRDSDGCA
jgi:hypothetical protein